MSSPGTAGTDETWLTEPLVEVGIKNPSLGFVNKECAVKESVRRV